MRKFIKKLTEGKKEQPPVIDQSTEIASLKNQIEFLKGQIDFTRKSVIFKKIESTL
jgi:hypothetical protein